MTRKIALAMIVFNAFCVLLEIYRSDWNHLLVDFTDVLQWSLVWVLAKQIDKLTAAGTEASQ